FPPPAKPPMMAPSPAPPPTMVAVRFPLPVAVRTTDDVSTGKSETEFNFNCRTAPPLKRPSGFASTTVPEAVAPLARTVSPPTVTGCARVAEKVCPGWLILEPSASPRFTVSTVPTGTTTGLDSAAFFVAPDALLPLADPLPEAAPVPLLLGFATSPLALFASPEFDLPLH